jgi:hypothetical protein
VLQQSVYAIAFTRSASAHIRRRCVQLNINLKIDIMKKAILFHLVILLFACSKSDKKSVIDNNQNVTGTEITIDNKPEKGEGLIMESVDMKSLFRLSPISVFENTTNRLTSDEKEALIKGDKSESWEVTEETNTRMSLNSSSNDVVEFHYFKNKNFSGGSLGIITINGQTSNLQLWKYSNSNLEKEDIPIKISANDFVSEEDKLPESFQPQLQYSFIDDEKIEVSLYIWMVNELEKRKVINKVFLKWDGDKFTKEIVKDELANETTKFKVLGKPTYDVSKLKHDGKIIIQKIWEDSNGENIVLFTKSKEELFAYHYLINGDNAKLLRRVYDFEKDCEFDLFIDFIENSIGVTDLDKNNLGEITFAYQKACISDVSPKELKLLMLENGNKYIIRGTTSIDKPGTKVDGSKKVDTSFHKAPASFLSHADKIWYKYEKE